MILLGAIFIGMGLADDEPWMIALGVIFILME